VVPRIVRLAKARLEMKKRRKGQSTDKGAIVFGGMDIGRKKDDWDKT